MAANSTKRKPKRQPNPVIEEVIVEPKPVSAKTARNRRRRQRKAAAMKTRFVNVFEEAVDGKVERRYVRGRGNVADPMYSSAALVDGKRIAFGSTENGRAWVRNFLHPGEIVPGVVGFPDASANPAARLSTMDSSSYSIPNFGTIADTWNFNQYVLPTEELTIFTVAWFKGVPEPSAKTLARGLGLYAVTSAGTYPDKSITISTANAANYDWQSYSDGETPAHEYSACIRSVRGIGYRLRTGDRGTPKIADNADKWRPLWMGITGHYDAPALTSQGTIWAGQVSTDFNKLTHTWDVSITEGEGDAAKVSSKNLVETYNLVDLPLSTEDLMQADSKAITHNIYGEDGGIYIPLRSSNAENPYVSLTASVDWDEMPPSNTVATGVIRFDGLGTDSTISPVDTPSHYPVSISSFLMCGCAFVRGIDKSGTWIVKSEYSVQATCDRDSAYFPFVTPGAVLDVAALQAAAIISQQMPTAFPAKYNDFGEILKVIGDVVKGVTGVAGALKNTGIPVISDIAGIVHGLGNAFV